ncbi:hypothetical protein GUJ93_ZPchr0009g1159 [Zizania palustris]|uniref:Nuclear transcription factor Y subunit n=1 Tax=Zizania palustris TaxID=103762 RepID=A0A8J5UXX7_ZIZPA|nr:hypothetical protein GUJ93_ZPchr0009g1159 [Zizania palustris]
MTSLVHDVSGHHGADDRQQQQRQDEPEDQQEASATSTGSHTMVATPPTDYATSYAHQDMNHALGQISYPNIDQYYGSLYAAYGGQPMMHTPLVGMHPTGLPLPTDAIEEPVYVNAKQYNAILRRRQSRAKAESEKKLVKGRKPYLHESRHQHALKRARGAGGRFLHAKSDGKEEHSDSSSKDKQDGVAPHSSGQPSASPSLKGASSTN